MPLLSDSLPFPVTLVRSHRKSTAIYVRNGSVEVRTGPRTSSKQIQYLLLQKTAWIEKTLERQAVMANEAPVIRDGAPFYYLGLPYTLHITDSKRSGVCIEGEKLKVTLNSKASDPVKILSKWMLEQAREYMPPLTFALARKIGKEEKLANVVFRKTRSKWGHCSSRGIIQYNWQIMQAPAAIIRYLACHEVCHLREMNHSRYFWQAVEQLDPDYRQHRKWLRNNQHRLCF